MSRTLVARLTGISSLRSCSADNQSLHSSPNNDSRQHCVLQVLCASTEEAVEPVAVPEGVPNGERVMVSGFDNAAEAQLNPKKKQLEAILPDMATDSGASLRCYICLLCARGGWLCSVAACAARNVDGAASGREGSAACARCLASVV